MSDGELESVAADYDSLTDLARQVLAAEQARRHLSLPADKSGGSAEEVDWEDLVVVKQFRDLPEAQLAKGLLDSTGIECFLADDNMVRMDWFWSNLVGGVKLCVRPADADSAVEILEQSPPPNFDVEGVGSYQQPLCPQCKSLDVSYETLNKPFAYGSAWIGLPYSACPGSDGDVISCGRVWQPPSPNDPTS